LGQRIFTSIALVRRATDPITGRSYQDFPPYPKLSSALADAIPAVLGQEWRTRWPVQTRLATLIYRRYQAWDGSDECLFTMIFMDRLVWWGFPPRWAQAWVDLASRGMAVEEVGAEGRDRGGQGGQGAPQPARPPDWQAWPFAGPLGPFGPPVVPVNPLLGPPG
jgi:hypothetical protein